jgi:hypothetical protein
VLGFTIIIPYSITPILQLSIIRLVEFHAVLLADPLPDETLGVGVDLKSLLDGFLQPIAAQQRITA